MYPFPLTMQQIRSGVVAYTVSGTEEKAVDIAVTSNAARLSLCYRNDSLAPLRPGKGLAQMVVATHWLEICLTNDNYTGLNSGL